MDNSQAASVLLSWAFEPVPLFGLLLSAVLYSRGWLKLSRLVPKRFPAWRLYSFLGGLVAVFVALASPLDAFASWLLSVHMVQHLLLTMVAPPLLLMGSPFLPMLSGLPRALARDGMAPFLNDSGLKKVGAFLVHPLFAGPLFMLSNLIWHVPAAYEMALGSRGWHQVEHLCFLATAVLFWWPVIQPWPSRPVWPRWAMIPYLLLADLQNTALSGFFTFYGRVLYPTYAAAPRISGLSAIDDQTAAGAIMWVPGSVAFLVPAGMIAIQALSGAKLVRRKKEERRPQTRREKADRPFDLLTVPLLGAAMRGRYFRRMLQAAMFLLAALVVLDGLFGPQVAAMNLAGVLPWTHWRGFTVVALLVAGNFFCMACPFTFARDLARRVFPATHQWPRALRSKWLAVGLLGVFFWAYEFFDLWATPWWTAWIVILYFTAAVLVDGFFKGASFCKYVCPIGQFHFVSSFVSPLEVKIRNANVCADCRTHDCLRGNETRRGCELHLFQPAKSGNMDCTFCLDCVQACPAENVGILAVVPGADLLHKGKRSGVGDFAKRPDIAALVLVLVFGAFINAAGMVEAFAEQWWVAVVIGIGALAATIACSWLAWRASGVALRFREILCGAAVMLAPLGFAMWLSHFVFHLLTGALTPLPVFQRLAKDLGFRSQAPAWDVATWAFAELPAVEILILNAGCLFTLWLLWVQARAAWSRHPVVLFAPWALLTLGLYAAGVWIALQPMEMRGTLMH
jgi:cytochrome c oxidase assembly factor CtaG